MAKGKNRKQDETWRKITIKAWSDTAFKQRLINNTNEVLKENGIPISSNVQYKIHEDSQNYQHLTLTHPTQFSEEELREECKNKDKFHKVWAEITIQAWHDQVFKQRVLKNPSEVLKEHGIRVPAGISYTVHENSPTIYHLSLRPSPELSETELKAMSGGATVDCSGPGCGWCWK